MQDPHVKLNAALAVTSAKSWKKIEAELKHSVRMISELCEKGANEEDQEDEELNLNGAFSIIMDIARLRM